MQDVEVPDAVQQLHNASWLLSDAYPRLSPEATGNASREDFEWAVSVSYSVLQPLYTKFFILLPSHHLPG